MTVRPREFDFTMNSWTQILSDTVQSGGSLVFFEDQVSPIQEACLRVLNQELANKVACVVRTAEDLVNERFQSRTEDLLIFFDEQVSVAGDFNSQLRGQRLWIKTRELGGRPPVDFIWDSFTQSAWSDLVEKLAKNWERLPAVSFFEGSFQAPALFLDRDDVIVKNVPYNGDPAQVELMPGIVQLIHRAHDQGMWVVMVSNQSGLGRGRIYWRDYQSVHQQMLRLLALEGAWLDECLWSSYIDNAGTPEGRRLAGLRKPRNGMFLQAQQKLRMSLADSIMVGDSASDLIAAAEAGLPHLYLFNSDKVAGEVTKLMAYQTDHDDFEFQTITSFHELVKLI